MRMHITGALGALALAAGLLPGQAQAFDRHDFTTTASTAGTTAYVVGKHKDDLTQARDFARAQRVALQREAAQGGGEHIDALADLLGERGAALGPWMQAHYDALYGHPLSADRLVDRVAALPS